MNCPIESHNPELLVDYAAGALDPETARALVRHIAGCAPCRSMAAGQTLVWKALDDWEAPSVSPDFNRRLYRRIDEEMRLSWWERLVRPFRSMPLRQALPLTATAGLLLTAGLLMQYPGRVEPAAEHGETVRADQVERTLDDLDLLGQFGTAKAEENVHPDAM
jgi:anti-sigma factor RsiW